MADPASKGSKEKQKPKKKKENPTQADQQHPTNITSSISPSSASSHSNNINNLITSSSSAAATTSSSNTKQALKVAAGTQIRTTKEQQQQQSRGASSEEDLLKDKTLRAVVKLPPGEDIKEWLAANTIDFFNQINMLYGVLCARCTAESCPKMSAGPRFEYRWMDGVKFKNPTPLSAPDYVEYLMVWVHEILDDRRVFPTELSGNFPDDFESTVKQIFKRLFRVYAHIYHCHFPEVIGLGVEAHLNTSFKHFMFFVQEFDLITSGDLTPLQEFIDTFAGEEETS